MGDMQVECFNYLVTRFREMMMPQFQEFTEEHGKLLEEEIQADAGERGVDCGTEEDA